MPKYSLIAFIACKFNSSCNFKQFCKDQKWLWNVIKSLMSVVWRTLERLLEVRYFVYSQIHFWWLWNSLGEEQSRMALGKEPSMLSVPCVWDQGRTRLSFAESIPLAKCHGSSISGFVFLIFIQLTTPKLFPQVQTLTMHCGNLVQIKVGRGVTKNSN